MSGTASSKKSSNIHDGHRERMRQRFRRTGSFDGFSEHEVIEMLLYYACPRRNTNDIAHDLIEKFGGISGIIEAEYEDLMEVKYITENAATLFKMIPKFMPMYYNSKNAGTVYDTPQKIIKLFEPCFVGLAHEEFRMACFNNKLTLIDVILLDSGDPSGAAVNIRKLIETALYKKASAIAVAHNHPKTSPTPSTGDINTTQLIIDSLKPLRIDFIDHIIVGEHQTISMSDEAYIKFLKN